MVDYLSIISKYTAGEHEQTVPALIIHCALVTKKALDIARRHIEVTGQELDLRFIEEAGMLHDIGIFSTDTPRLFTRGEGHYLTHIPKGARILEDEGLPRHSKAAQRHHFIRPHAFTEREIPLPDGDYVPQTPEEEILALADKFYSKRFTSLFEERSVEDMREYLASNEGSAVSDFDYLVNTYLHD